MPCSGVQVLSKIVKAFEKEHVQRKQEITFPGILLLIWIVYGFPFLYG